MIQVAILTPKENLEQPAQAEKQSDLSAYTDQLALRQEKLKQTKTTKTTKAQPFFRRRTQQSLILLWSRKATQNLENMHTKISKIRRKLGP